MEEIAGPTVKKNSPQKIVPARENNARGHPNIRMEHLQKPKAEGGAFIMFGNY